MQQTQLALRWPLSDLPTPGGLPGSGGGDDADDDGDLRGWDRAMRWALDLEHRPIAAADVDRGRHDLASLALFSPGNVAWRAVGRLLGDQHTVTAEGRWRASLTIATGLRTLFQRPESVLVIEQVVRGNETEDSYWRQVLSYSAAGDLQAVVDEYLHYLRSEKPSGPMDDQTLLELADTVSEVLALRTVTLRAFDPHAPDDPIAMRCRFALRYGAREGTGADQVRASEVRAAFNSPFWPFVMATTSAGQEGIDFHWWCSAVIHWNTPSNPVDFEQREGRVHRFGGHAVRRNVAAAHRADVLKSSDADPWRAAYDAALDASDDLGEFSPYWVFPGPAKIERHVLPYPLSRDRNRYEQLKVDLATYRLAFGQPRQEDMHEQIKRRGITQIAEPLDLRPPPRIHERDTRSRTTRGKAMTENGPEDTRPPAELMLVQVSEDAALVFGSGTPSWLEVQPILGATSADRAHLQKAAALAVGRLNVAMQVSPALLAARGIVQLSPTTMTALQTLEPIVGANGWNIGTLSAAGKFAHSVQWAPASGAAGLQFASNLGPAMTLVAIQVQLKDISRKLDENIALTKEVLSELGWANDAELAALVRDVHRACAEAFHVGAVTGEIYGEIRGKQDRIDKARTLLLTRVSAYVTELEQAHTPEARRRWLSDRAERSLNDLRSLVQLHQAWFVFQALRAANVAESDTTERGVKLMAKIRKTAQEQNRLTADLVVALADRLQRILGLLQESSDRRLGRFRSAAEAREVAQALRAKVLETLPAVGRSDGGPQVFLGRSPKLERASRMLPLVLEHDVPQMLAASCELGAFNGSAFLFVLPDELVLTREKTLFNEHALDHQMPSSSIRYVRTDKRKRTIELVAVERTFKLEWPLEASEVEVSYANDLLRSLMSLPAEEIPERPRSTAALLASVALLAGELDN